MPMNRFTVAQNIARFEKSLATTTDTSLIAVVEDLLKFERQFLGQTASAAVALAPGGGERQPSRGPRIGPAASSIPERD